MSAMNKDEAQRCINIAKRAIADGDILKATKFLNKSIALCPLDVAKGRECILLTGLFMQLHLEKCINLQFVLVCLFR